MKFNENPRTRIELFNTPELRNLKYKIIHSNNVTLVVSKNEMNKWLWQIFVRTFNSFENKCNFNKYHLKGHDKLVIFMRRLYNKFPLVFGYSIRHPLDEVDNEMGNRIALERLIVSIQRNEQRKLLMKTFEW